MLRKPIHLLVPLFLAAPALGTPRGGAAAAPTPKGDARLSAAVARIVRADYRADRGALAKEAEALAAAPVRGREKWADYWTAFAWWRRAVNGFNETPAPDDLVRDLERCAASARAALARDAGFKDARAALAGCLSGQMFLSAKLPEERRGAVYKEGVAVMKELAAADQDNPRSLWILGGSQAFAPPPWGGNLERAAATYRRGLDLARAEALSPDRREPWVPSWGAPELLMSLAFLGTVDPPNPALARAYAEGALAMVPDWHYVKEILLPRIDRLGAPAAPAATPAP